jgi:hypothetical protein
LTFLFEAFKLVNGQPVFETLIKFTFFASSIVSFFWAIHVFGFVVLVIELTESVAWFFTHSGINIQAVQAVELNWVLSHHPSLAVIFLALVAQVCFFAFFPFFSVSFVHLDDHYFAFFPFCSSVLFFVFVQQMRQRFDPFQQPVAMAAPMQHLLFKSLNAFFTDNMSVKVGHALKRNLIILEIESLENQVIGAFNSYFPRTMPYLSNLSQKTTFFDHVRSSPYTTWSVASLFATQCNLPLLMTPTAMYNRAGFHLLPQHRCLGDFFAMAGYKLHSYMANVFIGRFKAHQTLHQWRALDVEDHKMKRDWDLFDFIAKEVFLNLTNSKEQPFVLHIANADNHAFPKYFVDPRCKDRLPSYPLILRSFDCVDQILEKFIEAFKKSPLAESTEMFLYGDHLLMSGIHRHIKLFEPRFITAMFPLRPAQVIKKQLTIYDFAPTLMDVMGIDYEPKFPFGASVFSQKVGTAPGASHFEYIYNHFRNLMNWERQARCSVGASGFCRTT